MLCSNPLEEVVKQAAELHVFLWQWCSFLAQLLYEDMMTPSATYRCILKHDMSNLPWKISRLAHNAWKTIPGTFQLLQSALPSHFLETLWFSWAFPVLQDGQETVFPKSPSCLLNYSYYFGCGQINALLLLCRYYFEIRIWVRKFRHFHLPWNAEESFWLITSGRPPKLWT